MKNNSKTKILMNIVLLVILIGILIYLMDNSFNEIIGQLAQTSWIIVLSVCILGFLYQCVEGRSIKEIAVHFQKNFQTQDGFFTSCYVAFYRMITLGTGTLVSEIYFYKKKGIPVSKGVGITALHMVMYKLAVIFLALFGLITQFRLLRIHAAKMIPFLLIGILLTACLIIILLLLSISLNLQVLFVTVSNKWFKRKKFRDWIDQVNLQIYSLRAAVQSIMEDRSALVRIFSWNVAKLFFWYAIPYVVLIENHPSLDFLLVFSLTGFSVILSGVFPSPAGIGAFEFVYLMFFKPLVGTVDAVSSLLLYRFASMLMPFLIGTVYFFIQKRKELKIEIKSVKSIKNK